MSNAESRHARARRKCLTNFEIPPTPPPKKPLQPPRKPGNQVWNHSVSPDPLATPEPRWGHTTGVSQGGGGQGDWVVVMAGMGSAVTAMVGAAGVAGAALPGAAGAVGTSCWAGGGIPHWKSCAAGRSCPRVVWRPNRRTRGGWRGLFLFCFVLLNFRLFCFFSFIFSCGFCFYFCCVFLFLLFCRLGGGVSPNSLRAWEPDSCGSACRQRVAKS